MKNKLKITALLAAGAVALTIGITTAYYNTRSLAFDGTPVIASADSEKITFLDFTIEKKDILKVKEEIENKIPNESINIRNKKQ